MGVVIEICTKYHGSPTRITVTDVCCEWFQIKISTSHTAPKSVALIQATPFRGVGSEEAN
jgi:hypothetical protein